MSLSCDCCVLSGRGLCDGLITRPEESYWLWCVWVWSCKLEKWRGLGPLGAVEPLKKTHYVSVMFYREDGFNLKTTENLFNSFWNINYDRKNLFHKHTQLLLHLLWKKNFLIQLYTVCC
jgi:hypothetical protein